jgi:hypothetical protein
MRRFQNFSGIQKAIEQAHKCILEAAGQEVVPDIVLLIAGLKWSTDPTQFGWLREA